MLSRAQANVTLDAIETDTLEVNEQFMARDTGYFNEQSFKVPAQPSSVLVELNPAA